jgi:hypothetical protein
MRRVALVLLSLIATGCASEEEDKTTGASGGSEETPEVPRSDAERMADNLLGTWSAEKIEVVFLDPDGTWVSIPTSVYPDRWTRMVFTDGTPSSWLKLSSQITFSADGTMFNEREFLWDEDEDGEPDRSSYSEETRGAWSTRAGSVIMDTDDFYVESLVDFLSEDEAYLVWDRDDPLFMDDSCVFTMNIRRDEVGE